MGDCRSTPGARHPRRLQCPTGGAECCEVSPRTIAHHIREPWAWSPTAARYFFCDDPACELAYFGDDGSTIPRSQLRGRNGATNAAGDRLLCHCFGLTHAEFVRQPAPRDYIVAQTRAGLYSGATRNPSGRCCLKDFPDAGE